jgi:hypothetical protein
MTRVNYIFLKVIITGLAVFSSLSVNAESIIHQSDDVSVSFNLNANAVAFSQQNPWFGEDEANLGVEVDQWLELAVTPEINLTYSGIQGFEVQTGFSFVSTKSWGESADGIAAGLDDPSATTIEKAFVSVKRVFSDTSNLEVVLGNFDYSIGTGFLIKDGGADGGDRGGFYLGARSAFRKSALLRYTNDNWLVEGFFLENNPRRDGVVGDVAGANIEYTFGERGKLGFTYIDVVEADEGAENPNPIGEKLNTYDFRAQVRLTDALSLSGEYAFQSGGGVFDGQGYWINADYALSDVTWQPTFSYRYAVVTGDDQQTSDFEGFEPLAYGFSDYETWYQGEIAGNWVFANTNLDTHLIKNTLSFSPSLSMTTAYLDLSLNEPAALGIESDDFGNEVNVFLDWEASDNLFISASYAILWPGDGAEQLTGGDKTWSHFMLYASYSY